MTVETLSIVAGIVLSLAFSYIPKLSDKFASLDSQRKSLIMLGCLFLVALGSFALSCLNVGFETGVTCDNAGAVKLITIFVSAAIANQTTYMLSPQRKR